jgi:hypothetical protein
MAKSHSFSGLWAMIFIARAQRAFFFIFCYI